MKGFFIFSGVEWRLDKILLSLEQPICLFVVIS